ncbi:MAG: nucleotide exchange factor GrpE, partial [Candidatus Roizmanbacteria bacterium]|nr:nucleotide exchange factor GrpE [Candidatus Roizmanbacteria bacterium]
MKDKTDKPTTSVASEATTAVKEEEKECSCEECVCSEKECNKCEEQKKQVDEYKSKYLRAIADYQNYERRVQDQRVEWIKNANKTVILKLLTFLDDLERAEVFVTDPNLVHIKDSFNKMLKTEGLEEIEVLNKPYDPYTAEVIDMKEGEKDDMVIAVLRKGYTYNGQL